MSLAKLTLSRFKTFEDEGLELAPITLLTGANSSGKTSILQALCAITQGRESIGFPLEFCLNGPLVRLGDFRNVIHGHSVKGSFGIGLEVFSNNDTISVEGTFRMAEEGGVVATRSIALSDRRSRINVSWNQKQQAYFLEYLAGEDSGFQGPAVDLFGGSGADFDVDIVSIFSRIAHSTVTTRARTADSVIQEAAKSTNFDIEKIGDFLRGQEEELKKGKIRLNVNKFSEALSEVRKLAPAEWAIDRIRRKVSRALRQVAYVGAVRAHPLRYYATATAVSGFDPYGEGVSLKLAQWKETNRDRLVAVKDALIQLELATELYAEANLGEFVQVKITPKDRKYTDTIADVGFGISQVLPILVADIGLGKDGTLLINQPEVHLHPSSQALLANYFASRIKNRQYIIETHSEYLITRLRILVAQGRIKADDVALYFVMPTQDLNGKLIRRIEIGSKGELLNAPEEFFKTYISDSYSLAMSSFGEPE